MRSESQYRKNLLGIVVIVPVVGTDVGVDIRVIARVVWIVVLVWKANITISAGPYG
jgi:hypothetical protein